MAVKRFRGLPLSLAFMMMLAGAARAEECLTAEAAKAGFLADNGTDAVRFQMSPDGKSLRYRAENYATAKQSFADYAVIGGYPYPMRQVMPAKAGDGFQATFYKRTGFTPFRNLAVGEVSEAIEEMRIGALADASGTEESLAGTIMRSWTATRTVTGQDAVEIGGCRYPVKVINAVFSSAERGTEFSSTQYYSSDLGVSLKFRTQAGQQVKVRSLRRARQ